MLFNRFSIFGKSVLHILKKKREAKSKKQKQHKVNLKECNDRTFSRSRYAKLIPSQHFVEEKHRSSLHYVTLSELNEALFEKRHFLSEFSRQKHKCVTRSVARALKLENGKQENTRSLKLFVRRVEQLFQSLKVFAEITDDKDLLAMYQVMLDIWKEEQRRWKHDTLQHNKHSNKCCSCSGQMKARKNMQEPEGKVSEKVQDHRLLPTFKFPLTQQKHSCEIQECLLNMTPRKAVKKVENSSRTKTNHDHDTDEKSLTTMKRDSLKKLNFIYSGPRENVMHIEAKRLSQTNAIHCRAVAKLVDERLQQRQQETKHLICLYADYQDGSNTKLSTLKYDMLNTCLNAFFFPRKNAVNISWTDKITNLLTESVDEEFLTDIFERRYEIQKSSFKAVMVVSSMAAEILRHRHLGMLDTVTVILGIPRRSLLIVQQNVTPQLFH